MAANMVTLPEPDSGTKRRKLTTPKYGAFAMVLSAEQYQPSSQGLRGETVTKTLVKFVLSFQNFGEKIACAVRHNRIQPLLQYGCVALRMRFFSQNFGTIKRILPGSSSPSHREGPGPRLEQYKLWLLWGAYMVQR